MSKVTLELLDTCYPDDFQGTPNQVLAVPYCYPADKDEIYQDIKDEFGSVCEDSSQELDTDNLSEVAQDVLNDFSLIHNSHEQPWESSDEELEPVEFYAYIEVRLED